MAIEDARISLAHSDQEILKCFPVMRELRPHLVQDEFVARVRRQEKGGYRLAYLEHNGMVKSVAGFRFVENLVSGRFLYIDDLVSLPGERSFGFGGMLFDWLINQARALDCDMLELDSGVQRFGAHRFYLRKRMDIVSHHFRLNLRG